MWLNPRFYQCLHDDNLKSYFRLSWCKGSDYFDKSVIKRHRFFEESVMGGVLSERTIEEMPCIMGDMSPRLLTSHRHYAVQ